MFVLMRAWSSREAAEELGLSAQRIRALAGAGRLKAHKVGGRWVVDPATAARDPRAGRPLSSSAAWAILAELSSARAAWIHPAAMSRLRRRMREPEWVIESLRTGQARAHTVHWRALPSDLAKIIEKVTLVRTGLSAVTHGLDILPGSDALDAYVDRRTLRFVERQFRPARESDEPNLTLRVPDQPWVLTYSEAPLAVVAADLLLDGNPRVSRAGRDGLLKVLHGRGA